MKTLLVGINAKYIHPNLAIRSLKANTSHEVDLFEMTIKDKYEKLQSHIRQNTYQLVGISCYIWNIEIVKKIIKQLKDDFPHTKILLGGPEVSYEYNDYFYEYDVDYVIKGEGEIAFNKLLDCLANNLDVNNIDNLVTKSIDNKIEEIKDLSILNMAYELYDDHMNKIAYLESSRGCPFSCSFCMSSLEKKVRFFDIEKIKQEINYLYEKGTLTFKFLDRTFNTNKEYALDIINFIIMKDYKASFQFEITLDILDESIIHYLNEHAREGQIRFEVGVQSTNEITSFLVDREQDNDKLLHNIDLLIKGGKIDLHVDLIAGLPEEDIDSFKETFNTVINLKPQELQLGFLKMLHGTKIRNEANVYGYKYLNTSPYTIISNNYLSEYEVQKIKKVEHILDILYNKNFMNNFMHFLIDHKVDMFDYFYQVHIYAERNHKKITNYQVTDIFNLVVEYTEKNVDGFIKDDFMYVLVKDYLLYFKVKPKLWFKKLEKDVKNRLLRQIHEEFNIEYTLEQLYKYSVVYKYSYKVFLILYLPDKTVNFEFEL